MYVCIFVFLFTWTFNCAIFIEYDKYVYVYVCIHTYTLRQLHNANINFFLSETLDNNDDEMKVMDLLIHVLTYLEKVNAISYWSKGGCINKKANAEEEDEEDRN